MAPTLQKCALEQNFQLLISPMFEAQALQVSTKTKHLQVSAIRAKLPITVKNQGLG